MWVVTLRGKWKMPTLEEPAMFLTVLWGKNSRRLIVQAPQVFLEVPLKTKGTLLA